MTSQVIVKLIATKAYLNYSIETTRIITMEMIRGGNEEDDIDDHYAIMNKLMVEIVTEDTTKDDSSATTSDDESDTKSVLSVVPITDPETKSTE